MYKPRQFTIVDKENMQCPDCKVGLMPNDDKYFFCCSCGIMIEKSTGIEVLPDYMVNNKRNKKE